MPTVTQVLEAVCKVDEGAAVELVRMALYETLVDVIEEETPRILADISKRNDDVRRELVRKFIDARMTQQDVTPFMQAAGHLSLVEYEISKTAPANYLSAHNESQDSRGHFQRLNRGMDFVNAVTTTPADSQIKGQGDNVNRAGPSEKARMLGGALQTLTNHPHARSVGMVLDVIGQMAPEVQAVFGNWLKRFTYRYRGTERATDARLVNEMDRTSNLAAQLTSKDPAVRAQGLKTIEGEQGSGQLTGTGIRDRSDGRNNKKTRMTDDKEIADYNAKAMGSIPVADSLYKSKRDQTIMNTRKDVAVNYLIDKLPDMENVALSQKAGKMPPSQGMIISRDGDVKAISQGAAGDHYLPFDLKNLKSLHGGQYVRTRAVGGLTTEDIYAGLVTGARQVTVVSNTGVFTVTFDPDLRGGRRYNDKARGMVKRYEKMLGEIAGGNVRTGSLSAEQLKDMRQAAVDEVKTYNGTAADAKTAFERMQTAAQDNELFMREDPTYEAEANERALNEARESARHGKDMSLQAIARLTQDYSEDMKREAAGAAYRKLRLDGPGYNRAQKALEGEFPFLIKDTKFEDLDKWQQRRNLKSETTGAIRRTGVRVADEGHVSASQLDYEQKARVTGAGTSRRGAAPPVDEPTAAVAPTTAPATAGAAPAATGAASTVKQFGKQEHLHAERQQRVREIIRAGKNLKLDTVDAPVADDATLDSLKDLGQLATWWFGGSASTPQHDLVAEFRALPRDKQSSFLEVMSRPVKPGVGEDNTPAGTAQLHEYFRQIASGLVQVEPFHEPLTEAAILNDLNDRQRPYEIAAITALGPDKDKLNRWLSTAPQQVKDAVRGYSGKTNEEVRDDIQAQIDHLGPGAPHDTEEFRKLQGSHIAHTWRKAMELTDAPKVPEAAAPPLPVVQQKVGSFKKSNDPWDRLGQALQEILDA